MKNKIITFTLCLILVFTSINFSFANNQNYIFKNNIDFPFFTDDDPNNFVEYFNPSYINKDTYFFPGLTISPQIISLIGGVLVACGISFVDMGDVLDACKVFTNYLTQRAITLDFFVKLVYANVKNGVNGVVTVGKEVLDLIQDCFKDKFNGRPISFGLNTSMPFTPYYLDMPLDCTNTVPYSFQLDNFYYRIYTPAYTGDSGWIGIWDMDGNLVSRNSFTWNPLRTIIGIGICSSSFDSYYANKLCMYYRYKGSLDVALSMVSTGYLDLKLGSLDYTGKDSFESFNDKLTESGDLPIWLPGNLDSLIGANPSDILDTTKNPPFEKPNDGSISIPNIDNPSIGVGTDKPFVDSLNPPVDPPINPPVPPGIPGWGDAINMDFLKLDNITKKFPFSLPWDLKNFLDMFDVDPKAPTFSVPIVTEQIEIDFTIFDELANIIRFFVIILFSCSLIFLSTKMLG